MKTISAAAICAVVSVGLHAQDPATSDGKPASQSTEGLSKEEKNIRAYMELLRTDVRRSKSQIMGTVMQLDTEGSQRFWPIYKEFETELSKLGDQVVAVLKKYVENYGSMTDAVADQMGSEVLRIERDRNSLKGKYYNRVKSAMGGVAAMRFLQVENQLERLVDLQLASQLPVASE